MSVLTFADGGAFIFNDREIITKGCRTTCDIMAKYDLTVHVRCGKKKSKTEIMHFPFASTLKKWRDGSLSLPGNLDFNYDEVVKTSRQKRVNFDSTHENASETAKVFLDAKGGTFNFAKKFVHLENNVDFLIDDTTDVRCRMTKAKKLMGTLKFAWEAREAPLHTKLKIYEMQMNTLLWGS